MSMIEFEVKSKKAVYISEHKRQTQDEYHMQEMRLVLLQVKDFKLLACQRIMQELVGY